MRCNRRGMLSASIVCVLIASSTAHAELIAYWNFNSYDGNSSTISADVGAGTITLPGFPATNLDNTAGTTVNALFSNPAGTSLAVSNSANNGDWLDITISTVGYFDLVLTYATQRSATGFTNNQWSYSTNGGSSFTPFGTDVDPPASFGLVTIDFSSVVALNGLTNAILRYTFNDASSGTGNNRIDNLQLNATAPEPASLALLSLGAIGFFVIRRRNAPLL